jgi:hypothetical protein
LAALDVCQIGLKGLLWRSEDANHPGLRENPDSTCAGSRNRRSLTESWGPSQGNGQADGVFYLVENALFVVRRDRRINNLDRVTRAPAEWPRPISEGAVASVLANEGKKKTIFSTSIEVRSFPNKKYSTPPDILSTGCQGAVTYLFTYFSGGKSELE